MEKRKCTSCGNEFEKNKEIKKIKVVLNNPGEVCCEGVVITCPVCKEEYVEEKDFMQLAKSFDKAHEEKHNSYTELKKKIAA
jgi:uncharacterized protein with PIN domain